jgi:predicted aldo/keto reductase-like oxidoreductase
MWNYTAEGLTCIVYVEDKTKTLVIKVLGFDNHETAEMFAHYAMAKMDFDYHADEYEMVSKRIH